MGSAAGAILILLATSLPTGNAFPCPPLVDFVEGTPLPPRVGMMGSVTPFSPQDSAVFEAPVPFGGWWTRVNLTISAQAFSFSVAPTVAYALHRVSGFDSSLEGVLTCDVTYASGSVTGPKGVWNTTIRHSVLIGDPPWNPPNFHISVGGPTTFADWRAEVTPCYLPGGAVTC